MCVLCLVCWANLILIWTNTYLPRDYSCHKEETWLSWFKLKRRILSWVGEMFFILGRKWTGKYFGLDFVAIFQRSPTETSLEMRLMWTGKKKKKTEKFWVLDVIVERLHLPALHAVMWNGGLICFEDWGFMVSATYNRRCLNSDSILNQPLIFHLIPNRFIKATSFLSTLSFPPVGRTRNLGVILEHFPSYIL